MINIEATFEIRPFERPARARDVRPETPGEGDVEVGDEVVLHPVGHDRKKEVYVRISAKGKGGSLVGTIERANRLGARGHPGLEKGDVIRFDEKNVMRLVKAR